MTVIACRDSISRSQLVRLLAAEMHQAQTKVATYNEAMGIIDQQASDDPKMDEFTHLLLDAITAGLSEEFASQLLDGEVEEYAKNFDIKALVLDTLKRLCKAWPEDFTSADIQAVENHAPQVVEQIILVTIEAFNLDTTGQKAYEARWRWVEIVTNIAHQAGVEPYTVLSGPTLHVKMLRLYKTREEFRVECAKYLGGFVESLTKIIKVTVKALVSAEGDELEDGEFEELMSEFLEDNGFDLDVMRDRLATHLASEELRIYGPE